MSTDSEKIFDGITEISDETIEELYSKNTPDSGKDPKKKYRQTAVWIAAAAGIVLIAAGGFSWRHLAGQADRRTGTAEAVSTADTDGTAASAGTSESTSTAETAVSDQTRKGVTIPKEEVYLKKPKAGTEADMIAFFIYQGSLYRQYDWIYDNDDMVGERLGTAAGLIDEWTPDDGYVELAGSIGGDFYSVKGYDPSCMLCMKFQDRSVLLFVCGTGMTVTYGSELYTDRLHLPGNYVSFRYETRNSWYKSKGELYQLDASGGLVRTLVEELNDAEFILSDSICPDDGGSSIYEMELYHLYFKMQNGTTIHLRLLEGGYVVFDGMPDVCVRLTDETCRKLLEVLENHTGAVPAPDQPAGTTLEDCRNDPELGKYVPAFVPDNAAVTRAEILYYLDPETAEETGTKELSIEFSVDGAASKWYAVTVTWASEYGKNGWAGPMTDLSLLNEETIPNGKTIGFGIWVDDASVVLSGRGLDAGTAYKILKSVNDSTGSFASEK